jgi:hypothetical protein
LWASAGALLGYIFARNGMRTYTVAAEDRTLAVAIEDRTLTIAAEDRTYNVDAE